MYVRADDSDPESTPANELSAFDEDPDGIDYQIVRLGSGVYDLLISDGTDGDGTRKKGQYVFFNAGSGECFHSREEALLMGEAWIENARWEHEAKQKREAAQAKGEAKGA